jgi:hypothetical protein
MPAVVLVQHPVADFAEWKQMFDSDPAGRRENGVKRYRIYRSPDADYIAVELEFDSLYEATEFRDHLESVIGEVWKRLGVEGPVARVLEEVETGNP